MNHSKIRVSINIFYVFLYILLSLIVITYIEHSNSEYKSIFKYSFVFGIMTLYYIYFEKIVSFTYEKFNLKENDKEDFLTLFKSSKKIVKTISFLVSMIVSFVVFSIFKEQLLVSVAISFVSFVLTHSLINTLIKKSLEK